MHRGPDLDADGRYSSRSPAPTGGAFASAKAPRHPDDTKPRCSASARTSATARSTQTAPRYVPHQRSPTQLGRQRKSGTSRYTPTNSPTSPCPRQQRTNLHFGARARCRERAQPDGNGLYHSHRSAARRDTDSGARVRGASGLNPSYARQDEPSPTVGDLHRRALALRFSPSSAGTRARMSRTAGELAFSV